MAEELWSSRFGFIVASIGAAIGLGNIWRFPAVVGQNGGGAYLVPYFIAAFAFGVPLMILEMSVGRDLKSDVVGAFRQVHHNYAIVGWIVTGTVLIVLSYYLVITGWVLSFLFFTLFGINTTFTNFTSSFQPIIAFLVCTLAVGAIVTLGIRKGIERIAKVFIPFVFIVLVGLAIYALTLPGIGDGLEFFFTPDLTVLSDPFIWSAAFGQVFFSLSVGQGIMLTYGSYVDRETNIPKSTVIIAVADLSVALLAGMVIFPLVFTFSLEPTMGTELAFSTLPTAFESIGSPLGTLVGVAFFGALFVAAVTPSVAMMEVGVASLTNRSSLDRTKVTIVTTVGILALGMMSALSYSVANFTVFGERFLDLLDSSLGTLGLPITAIAIAVVFTWIQDSEAIDRQLGASIVRPIVAYAVPTILCVVIGLRLVANVDFGSWRRLPGSVIVNNILRTELTLVVFVILAFGGWILYRKYSRG